MPFTYYDEGLAQHGHQQGPGFGDQGPAATRASFLQLFIEFSLSGQHCLDTGEADQPGPYPRVASLLAEETSNEQISKQEKDRMDVGAREEIKRGRRQSHRGPF